MQRTHVATAEQSHGPPMIALKKNSAFAVAVRDLLNRVAATFPEHIKGQPITVVVAGGAAVHLYTGHRVSDDLDVEFLARVRLPSDAIITYPDEDGRRQSLMLDINYNPTLGCLHEDYVERAMPVGFRDSDPRLDVRVLAPVDLMISKLGRFADNDREDIAHLAKRGLVTPQNLMRLGLEAIDYYIGNDTPVRANLIDAIEIIRENAPNTTRDRNGPPSP